MDGEPGPAAELARWQLDPGWAHLNHGSYGARTRAVGAHRAELVAQLEENPTHWRESRFPALLDHAKGSLAATLGAPPDGLVLLPNVTSGVSAALRAGTDGLRPGDEILVLEHTYGSCRATVERAAHELDLVVRVAASPVAPRSPGDLVDSVLAAVSPRTKIALLDHASSRTGVVYPLDHLVAALPADVLVVVDGAHGPGMLDVPAVVWERAIYVGAGYKWLCAPLGTAFMVTPPRWRDSVIPTTLGHGWFLPAGSGRHHALFDWPGAIDPVPWLAIPRAIEELCGGDRHRLAGVARLHGERAERYAREWHERAGVPSPLAPELQAAMRLLRLPVSLRSADLLELTSALRRERIEAKVTALAGETMLRLSVHSYVCDADVDRLAWAVGRLEG